jgi:hypothetical protein
MEAGLLQDFLDASVHPFDPAMGLRMARRDQAMRDAFLGTGLVEGVVPAGFPLRRPGLSGHGSDNGRPRIDWK